MSSSSPSSVVVQAWRACEARAVGTHRWRSHLAMALCAALAVACSGDSTAPTALTITPASPVVRVGNGLQLAVQGADGPVTWTTSDAGIASVAAGMVDGVAAGTATITAAVGTRSAEVQVVVTRPPTIVPAATAIAFGSTANGATPDAQTVSVTNGGDETLDGLAVGTIAYAGGASDWLSASVSPAAAPAVLTLRPTTAALQAGTYTATVPITSSTGVNSPQTVIVTYVIGPTPVIKLGQPIANFTAQTSGAVAATQSVTITNVGGGTLSGLAAGSITYSSGASDWLSANINPSTAPATLTMQPATTDLSIGTYTATVPVLSTVPGVAAAQVVVTYQVTAAPAPPSIALAASTADFQATAGGAPPTAQAVGVANSGGGTLSGLAMTVTYEAGQPTGWLTATLGGTNAPTTVTLEATTVPPAGMYTAHVAISSASASNSPQEITVTFTVATPPPVINLTDSTASFTTTSSADPTPPTQTVGVSNSGGGTLTGLSASISYADTTTGWLSASVAPTAPDAPDDTPLSLTVTTGAITPGSYHATVTVSSTDAGVAPKSVAVTFTRIATLTGDVQGIFTANCTNYGCHVAASAYLGVNLSDAAQSYNSLVGKPAVNDPMGRLRVAELDSASSYLLRQLSRDPMSETMPAGCPTSSRPCVSSDLIHLIAVWIQQGAHP